MRVSVAGPTPSLTASERLRAAEEFKDPSVTCFASWVLTITYAYQGDLARARECADRAVQTATTPSDRLFSDCWRAWVTCRTGAPAEAVEVLSAALPPIKAANFMPGVAAFSLALGEGYWLAGELDNARQTLEEVVSVCRGCEMRFHEGSALRFLGEIARPTNPEQSAQYFERSIGILRDIGAENELALAYAGYGRLHREQGHIQAARRYLTQALTIFERLGTLGEPDRVREALGQLT